MSKRLEGCYTCEHADETKGRVLYTEFWNVFLNPNQAHLGRVYVNLGSHAGALSELTPDEWEDYAELAPRLELGIERVFGATMFNWTCLLNNAFQEEQPKPHVHHHLRPRYDHPVEFAGTIFEDPEFGLHYDRERKLYVPDEVFNAITERLAEEV